AKRRERSVAGFGRSMRALGRGVKATADETQLDVFVPSKAARGAPPTRRPVPAAQEALMSPVDRSELSEARQQMMKRRRRSLSILIGGSILFTLIAVITGGLLWAVAAPFLVGLV